jgi:hypothetical protein
VSLGFDVIRGKQMTATRRSPSDESTTIILPLFIITLPRIAKSQEFFRLPSLCHIAIRVEAYRAQNGLTQCHNCQKFGHICANCKPLHIAIRVEAYRAQNGLMQCHNCQKFGHV